MALVEDDVRRLVESLQQPDNVAAVVGDDLDELIDIALQHRRHADPPLSPAARDAHGVGARARGVSARRLLPRPTYVCAARAWAEGRRSSFASAFGSFCLSYWRAARELPNFAKAGRHLRAPRSGPARTRDGLPVRELNPRAAPEARERGLSLRHLPRLVRPRRSRRCIRVPPFQRRAGEPPGVPWPGAPSSS